MNADFFKYGEKASVFENTRLRVVGEIRFKNATCGSRLFLNTEEKISVFENTRPRVDGALEDRYSDAKDSASTREILHAETIRIRYQIWTKNCSSLVLQALNNNITNNYKKCLISTIEWLCFQNEI